MLVPIVHANAEFICSPEYRCVMTLISVRVRDPILNPTFDALNDLMCPTPSHYMCVRARSCLHVNLQQMSRNISLSHCNCRPICRLISSRSEHGILCCAGHFFPNTLPSALCDRSLLSTICLLYSAVTSRARTIPADALD